MAYLAGIQHDIRRETHQQNKVKYCNDYELHGVKRVQHNKQKSFPTSLCSQVSLNVKQ